MYEHKNEILSSRVGCLGASDGNIIAYAAANNEVQKSALKRLAIVKGLVEPKDGLTTDAMRLGDDIEMLIFENLKLSDERWQSNYRFDSVRYSRKNVKLIAHIDFFLKDDEKQVLRLIECKATKNGINNARYTYANQLYIEHALAKEYAATLGKKWKVELMLCHYDTNGYVDFDPSKIETRKVAFKTKPFDIDFGMDVIDRKLESLNEFYEDGDIDADALPIAVKKDFDLMTNVIREIEARQRQVDDFKAKLYDFFLQRGIKSVKSDDFTITLVEPTTIISFDAKKYLEDYEKEHPYKCQKIKKQYEKKSNRKGYVQIKVKH